MRCGPPAERPVPLTLSPLDLVDGLLLPDLEEDLLLLDRTASALSPSAFKPPSFGPSDRLAAVASLLALFP